MNPFDQFAGTLQAALPPQPSDASVAPSVAPTVATGAPPQQQFNLMAPPAQERKPVMNAPGTMPQPMQGGMGGMPGYGAPPPQQQMGMAQPGFGAPQMGGMGTNQPPPPQMMMAPTQSMMGGFGMNGSATSVGGPAPMQQQLGGPPQMSGALVPSAAQSNPYALGPPAAAANPFGAPAPGMGPPPQPQQANPFGAPAPQPGMGAPPAQMGMGAPPAQHQQPGAFGAPPAPPAMDPFGAPPAGMSGGMPGGMPAQPPAPQIAADPFGAPPPAGVGQALVPSAAPPGNDPFGIFGAGPSSGASVAPSVAPSAVGGPPSVYPGGTSVAPSVAAPVAAGDPWAEMGFGSPAAGPAPGENDDLFGAGLQPTGDETAGASESKPDASPKRKKGELPPGGEWYDAKIFTPTLGVMFFKPKELVDSLFLQTDKKLVDALEERPVVAFIVEGSSARSAGVELGHVLLKVNGIDVRNPKEASRLIKEGPRPLPLLFYVPQTSVVVAEGEHMVKYNTKETGAPNSAKDWKPKYVVVGGIIAQPWMMNMYRSKSEYDIAVIETQARRPVSVKVKQFSLQGARIQNDWQGPQMVKYKNKLHPWKYVVVLPISRNPIKIASPNLSQLKPVHEGIRRVLQAQQRDRGGHRHGAGPAKGPTSDGYYRRGGEGGYDARDRERNGGSRGGGGGGGAYYSGGGRESRRGGY